MTFLRSCCRSKEFQKKSKVLEKCKEPIKISTIIIIMVFICLNCTPKILAEYVLKNLIDKGNFLTVHPLTKCGSSVPQSGTWWTYFNKLDCFWNFNLKRTLPCMQKVFFFAVTAKKCIYYRHYKICCPLALACNL